LVNGALIDSEPDSLHCLEGLEQLILYRTDLWDFGNPYIRASLQSFLDALPSPNSLSYIELEDFFEAGTSLAVISGHCTRLASALADRTKFPKLQRLKFRTTVVKGKKPTLEEWEAKRDDYWRVLRNVGVKVEVPGHL
jgi:hypothetical protein